MKNIKKIVVICTAMLLLSVGFIYASTKYVSQHDFIYGTDIYCIAKAQTFYEGEYTIKESFDINGNSNNMKRALAYAATIRNNQSATTDYENHRGEHKGDSAQWAVWKITKDRGSSIPEFNGLTLSQDTSEYTLEKDMYGWESQTWRYRAYGQAKAYGNYSGVNAPSEIIIEEKTSDNKVKINLGNYNTTGEFTDSNSGETTKLELGGIKEIKITADGKTTTYNKEEVKKYLEESNGKKYFVISNAGDMGEITVEVTYYETVIDAHVDVLTKTGSQTIMEAKGQRKEVTTTKTSTKIFNTDVSLQKYITKVNNKALTNNETDLTNRKNTYSRVDETSQNAKRVVAKVEENSMQKDTYKRSNVVQIEAGDTVTYRIYVYNNSKITAKRVDVRDKLLYYGNTQYGEYEILSITRDNSTRNIKNEWTYVKGTSPNEYGYSIYDLAGNSYTYFDVTVKLNTYIKDTVIDNTAYISGTNPTNNTEYRTEDRDYVKMKPYKVSLQKIVYSVNGKTQGITSFDRWNSWESNENVAKPQGLVYAKHNNPVMVANGDYVTYAIRVRNDGDTKVYINNIKDTLPEGLSEYKQGVYDSSVQYKNVPEDRIINLKINRIFNPGDDVTLYVTAKVSESNMSTRLLRNYAEITEMSNQNNVTVEDTTPDNNQDADYIILKDIVIEGTVWNDKAPDKKQDNYNGVYDEKQENKLKGIKVYLYRNGKGIIAKTITDDNGNYHFDSSMIDKNVVTHNCERHIKAPYECSSYYTANTLHGANYWKENGYYSYYIVFEYDGITYTNTIMGDINAENYVINSNSKEDNGVVKETRKEFNDRFSTINNEKEIKYTTKNEDGYIPQSNHIYDEKTMSIESSTNLITLSNNTNLEDQLKHVNLGLRGRDIFDLELTSDVASTKVTVNGQSGVYKYGNKVTLRGSDIGKSEDMANKESEKYSDVSDVSYTQDVRNTDLDVNKANQNIINKYDSTGLGIEVTYKITVTNASQTVGTASKIVDYYDSRYSIVNVYNKDNNLSYAKGNSGEGYKSIVITTPETKLTQGESMEIYVVLTLNNVTDTLKGLLSGTEKIPTYNMAEVYEYKTYTTNNNEATRGLLDKDSAPGSVETEKARLVSGTTQNTTVEYYFKAQNLSNLKYEDDTYATPTLYFANNEEIRTLSGVVFKDNTTTDNNTRIKTGNGIKDENEVGVYGATVKLIEGKTVRYETTTDKDGKYTFTNFLPGNYTIEYSYGDTKNTVLLNQNGDVNKYSFNGEDYQSTNNIGSYGAKKLNDTKGVWYAYNEKDKVSTGTDNEERREVVTTNVTNFTDEEMSVLNNARDGKTVSEKEVNNLMEKTSMYATTPNFTLTVEKTETDKNNANIAQKEEFSKYEIENMNFGIAEVPVTTIDLQKHVQSFTIKDSTGENTIASAIKKDDGTWSKTGDVIPLEGSLFDVSIEDEKLQGAKLEVTYNISIEMTTEKDFRNKEVTVPTIDGIADYIDNDLSYNETLGDNSKYWKVETYDNIKKIYALSQYKEGTVPSGTIDAEGNKYTSVLVATENNPILLKKAGYANCTITLEKTLSSTESTLEDIITSNVDTYEYNNNVEILKLNYENAKNEDGSITYRDRVRTKDRYIILAGTQHDSATSETITIHPPTGKNNSINYYVIAVISLGILAAGAFGIKKYVVKK